MTSVASMKAQIEKTSSTSPKVKPPPPKPSASKPLPPKPTGSKPPAATVTISKPKPAAPVLAKQASITIKVTETPAVAPAAAPKPAKPVLAPIDTTLPPPEEEPPKEEEEEKEKAVEQTPPPQTTTAPSTPRSLPATPRALLAMITPPTAQEQDYIFLYALSFLIPHFALRFVFEVSKRVVLAPARAMVRYTPGSRKLLSFLYVKLGPMLIAVKERLPGMEYLNAVGRAALERFLATLSTAAIAAGPHVRDFAESVKNLEFRAAFAQFFSVLKAWAPMLLLVVPFAINAAVVTKDGILWFSHFSKTAIYKPFGSLLKSAVARFGKALSENPDLFAETISWLLGPLVLLVVGFAALVWVLGVFSDSPAVAVTAVTETAETAAGGADAAWVW